jgi:hypothetical protein
MTSKSPMKAGKFCAMIRGKPVTVAAYYFGHHRDAAPLPVYRAVRDDESATRFYVDAVSGELIGKIDSSAKRYRWPHQGLHCMDFNAAMRGRPEWDVLMLLLLSGVTFV